MRTTIWTVSNVPVGTVTRSDFTTYAVRVPLRAARRADQADAGQQPGTEPRRILAESDDKRVYEFTLRKGVKFYNGDPFTAEDFVFSFKRTKRAQLHEKLKEVMIVDPHKVRFVLHEPWPDFMTIYGTLASTAAWIVPIVVLSDSLSPHEVLLAITSGADAFLAKNEIGPHLFLKSIELTLLGAVVIPQGLVLTPMFSEHEAEFGTDIRLPGSDHDTLLPIQTARAGPGLSAREQLVLRRLMEGASNKVIARDIGIAETTVKVHVKSLLRKIQVSNRPQAAMWGINHLSEAGEVLSSSGSINQGE